MPRTKQPPVTHLRAKRQVANIAGDSSVTIDVYKPEVDGTLRKAVFLLALPVLIEQLLNFMVGFYDIYLSGHLAADVRTAATAAVGVAAYVGWLATMVFALVATGTTALVTRAYGAGDNYDAERIVNRSIALSLALGVVLISLVVPLAPMIVQAMGLSGQTAEIAVRYLRLDAIGLGLSSSSFVIAAALRGCEDTKTPMWIFGLVNVINVVASTWLVYGGAGVPSLGIDGIVIGTVIARCVGAVMFLLCMVFGLRGLELDRSEMRLWGVTVGRILRIGGPAAVDGILMWVGHCIFLRIVASLSPEAFAAHIVGVRVEGITYLPAVAWGAAAATLVGNALGRGEKVRAREAGNEAMKQCLVLATVITLLFTFGASWIFHFMHADTAVQTAGTEPFRIVGLFQIPLVLSIVYFTALRAAGAVWFPLFATLLSTFLIRLPLGYYLGVHLGYGLMGAWMGMNLDMLVRGIAAVWWYWRRDWEEIVV